MLLSHGVDDLLVRCWAASAAILPPRSSTSMCCELKRHRSCGTMLLWHMGGCSQLLNKGSRDICDSFLIARTR